MLSIDNTELPHYLVFKELFERFTNFLSKLSKTLFKLEHEL